jgi:hypothetical protein
MERSVIRFTSETGNPVVVAETKGFGIYLDNDSLSELATGNASRRNRFVDLVKAKATLLFSWSNAIEVSTTTAVRAFLDDIGPDWVPLELNPWKVAKREAAGLAGQAAVSTSFIQGYLQERIHDLSHGGRVLDGSSQVFFQLGAVVEWMLDHRDKIRPKADQIDAALRERLATLWTNYERDPTSLDKALPPCEFNELSPATFALTHLQRLLIHEWKQYHFRKHDGLDLCHAALAAAYGSLITLDKHWKRRVLALPNAEKLARTYYRNEIDDLIAMMDALASE